MIKKIILFVLLNGFCLSVLAQDVSEVNFENVPLSFKNFFYNQLVKGMIERCIASGTDTPSFAYGWYNGEPVIIEGRSGWRNEAPDKQGINTGVYFRDTNGNGRRDNDEPIWSGKQIYNGEAIIAGQGPLPNGAWGKQKGLFYYDENTNGRWDNEGLWLENTTPEKLLIDIQAFHTKINELIPKFVNHKDSGGQWGGHFEIPYWSESALMADLNEERQSVPGKIEDLNPWLKQQSGILKLLKWLKVYMTQDNESWGFKSAVSDNYYPTFYEAYESALQQYNLESNEWITADNHPYSGWSPDYWEMDGIGACGYTHFFADFSSGTLGEVLYEVWLTNVKGELTWTYGSPTTLPRSVDVYLFGFNALETNDIVNFYGNYDKNLPDTEYAFKLHASEEEGDQTTNAYTIEQDTPYAIDPTDAIAQIPQGYDYWEGLHSLRADVGGVAVIKITFPEISEPPIVGFINPNTVRDTNADGLVDVGADLISFGNDTGTMNFNPELPDPLVYIPLAVNFWDRLPVHAYITQGGHNDPAYDYWTHPDAEEKGLLQAYSLHSRARINTVIINDVENIRSSDIKRIEVVRPRGNVVVFEFERDGTEFSQKGYPTGLDEKRTYVLWDITPDNHEDLQYELHFDSGIIHHFAGRITEVSHIDGRSTDLYDTFPSNGGNSGINIDWINNTVKSNRYNIDIEWKNGHVDNLKYKTKDGEETIITSVKYDGSKEKITKLSNTIPEYSAEIDRNTIKYGTGITVGKLGNDITTTIPGIGSATATTAFNSNELVSSQTVKLGTDKATTSYEYYTGTDRYDNGSPKWSKVKKISYPDNSYEEFEYATYTGWLSKHKTLFLDALTRITEYSYDYSLSGGYEADQTLLAERPRKTETKIGATVVGLDFYAYQGGASTTHFQAVEPTATTGTASNLIYGTGYNTYGPHNQSTPAGNYTYNATLNTEKTELTVNSITPADTGVSKTNEFGTTFYSSTTRDGLKIAESTSTTDSFGRITETKYPLDATDEDEIYKSFTPFGPQFVKDREGLSTTYTYYPSGRIKTAKLEDAIISYEYDALGNTTKTTTAPNKGDTTVEIWKYDAKSRPTAYTKKIGTKSNNTKYVYTPTTTTITYSDGTPDRKTEIRQKHLDGRTKAVTGTAVSPMAYVYSVTPGDPVPGISDPSISIKNGIATKVCNGSSTSKDWSISYTDMVGKAYLTKTPGNSEANKGYWQQTLYDSAGRPESVSDSNGKNTVNTYNSKNELTSVKNNNVNITNYTYGYLAKGGKTAYKTTSSIVTQYGTMNTENYASIDGLDTWEVINGYETHTATVRHEKGTYTKNINAPFNRKMKISNEGDKNKIELNINEGIIKRSRTINGNTFETKGRAENTAKLTVKPWEMATSKAPDGKITTTNLSASRTIPEKVQLPDKSVITPKVDGRGNLQKLEGEAPGIFEASSTFDDQYRQKFFLTTGEPGAATTEFIYDPVFGTLEEKIIEGNSVYRITRLPDGRIESIFRQLDEEVTVTKEIQYTDDAFKFYRGVTYTDGTPDVELLGHDSVFGLPSTIGIAGLGAYTIKYNKDLQIEEMDLSPESQEGITGQDVKYNYANLKRSSMDIDGTESVSYAYDDETDNLGRVKKIAAHGVEAEYTYEPDSMSLVKEIAINAGGNSYTRDFKWEKNADRIDELNNLKGTEVIDSFDYSYDAGTGKVNRVSLETGSCNYKYDKRGQLKSAIGPDGTYRYDNDSITNVLSGGKIRINGSDEFTQTQNLFNQITARITPNAVEIRGTAGEEATITGYIGQVPTLLNTFKAARFNETFFNGTTGEPELRKTGFSISLPSTNDNSPAKINLHIVGVKFDDTKTPETGGDQPENVPGSDIEVEVVCGLVRPRATDNTAYDTAGRLRENSIYTYSWDAEDRLTSVESKIPIADDDKYVKVDNSYDHAGRRIKKVVSESDTGLADSWTVARTHEFHYDSVLLNGAPADFGVLTSETVTEGAITTEYAYLWGPDINGYYQGMGGVGGLLAVVDKTNTKTYIPSIDKQGTVYSYVDAATGTKAQELIYDPYGRIISNTGTVDIPLKHCTRYYDKEIGCYYYGFRYYDPSTCKWLSRDPIGEAGGYNLYAFCSNDPVNCIDYLGLALYAFDGTNNTRKDLTNIFLMREAYGGKAEYYRGVGNNIDFDAVDAAAGKACGFGYQKILKDAYRDLTKNFSNGDTTIDIIGFSRGGVMAVLFAKMIEEKGVSTGKKEDVWDSNYGQHSVNIMVKPKVRFLGLFDPVPGPAGFPTPSKIPDNVEKTAIAYSLHEMREDFHPLLVSGNNIIRRGFPGGHSDVGGGYKHRGLANAPLAWMVAQGGGLFNMPNLSRYPELTGKMIPHQEFYITTDAPWSFGRRRRFLPKNLERDPIPQAIQDYYLNFEKQFIK